MDRLEKFFVVIFNFMIIAHLFRFHNFRIQIETTTLQFSFSYTSQIVRLVYIMGGLGGPDTLKEWRSEFTFEMLENYEPLESAILNL